jgi:heparin binding hemagglutinin HbhA
VTEQTKTRFPSPLYAAAGAGDLAWQELRKLPAAAAQLGDRAAASLRSANTTATATAGSLRERAGTTDFDKLRNDATANAVAFAKAAQEQAASVYSFLVARGERVVGTGVVEAAEVVNADIEATEETKAVAGTPAEAETEVIAEAKPAAPKPRKRAAKAATPAETAE